jgi:DNA topoisomerase-1
LATGKNFDASGRLDAKASVQVLSEVAATAVATGLAGADVTVLSINSTPRTQKPQPPFMTSSLQIEASRKLRFDPERTMRAAQRLYEQGWITYMRTDSTTLSDEAINAARSMAASMFGDDYVADAPRRYDRKSEERPGGPRSHPAGRRELSLPGRGPEPIGWRRTCGLRPHLEADDCLTDGRCALTQDKVRLTTTLAGISELGGDVEAGLSATGLRIEFPGFRRAYVEGMDDPEAELADQERILPALARARSCRSRVPKPRVTTRSHPIATPKPR